MNSLGRKLFHNTCKQKAYVNNKKTQNLFTNNVSNIKQNSYLQCHKIFKLNEKYFSGNNYKLKKYINN